MVEHMLKGHVIIFKNSVRMYIGIIDKKESLAGLKDRRDKPYKGEAVYGIKVVGVDSGKYKFVLTPKYKRILYDNIINGTEYYK